MISENDLWYIAGNVDGDGSVCVYGNKASGHGDGILSFSIGKAKKNVDILHSMRGLVGGRIVRNREAKGNSQAMYSLTKQNAEAVDFCELIKDYVQLKKPQFVLASNWPTGPSCGQPFRLRNRDGRVLAFESLKQLGKDERFPFAETIASEWVNKGIYPRKLNDKHWTVEQIDKQIMPKKKLEIRQGLKKLKSVAHEEISGDVPVAYFSGCFDSEGCIGVHDLNGVEVSLTQKHRAICDALVKKYGGGVTGGKNDKVFKWYIKNHEGCMHFINDILPYCLEKKQQLELVKNMPVNGAPDVARKLRELKGNQGKGPKDKPDKVAQKRLHGLPRYMTEIRGGKDKKSNLRGYGVKWPNQGMIRFVNSMKSLEENLLEAKQHLASLIAAQQPPIST